MGNGDSCRFCHENHEKRTAHLGRQHRRLLEEHTLAESLTIALPVLRDKFEWVGLSTADLDALPISVETTINPIKAKDGRSLERALRSMPLKTTLLALRRAGTSDSALLAAFDEIV